MRPTYRVHQNRVFLLVDEPAPQQCLGDVHNARLEVKVEDFLVAIALSDPVYPRVHLLQRRRNVACAEQGQPPSPSTSHSMPFATARSRRHRHHARCWQPSQVAFRGITVRNTNTAFAPGQQWAGPTLPHGLFQNILHPNEGARKFLRHGSLRALPVAADAARRLKLSRKAGRSIATW